MSAKNKIGPIATIEIEGNKNKYKVQWDEEDNNFGCICYQEDGTSLTYNISEATLMKMLKGQVK